MLVVSLCLRGIKPKVNKMDNKNNNLINRIKPYIKKVLNTIPYISGLSRQIKELGAFPAGHYYSPIPARADVSEAIENNRYSRSLHGIRMRHEAQLSLLNELAEYYADVPYNFRSGRADERYYYDQEFFGYTDAIVLFCMIQKYQFKNIIEVGSGFSSAAILDAYQASGISDFQLTLIEPYPDRVKSLIGTKCVQSVELVESAVQECQLDLFETLDAGDMLFIDSSHVVKFQSDLHYLIFHVLPVLKPGVLVHFHDVFFPFEYPDHWLLDGRYWNECYFLQAFLTNNDQWEIELFNDYLNTTQGDVLTRLMPLCHNNHGGSIYIRKQ